jgi:DNA-binding transcriptional LysR family regulator
VPSDGRRGDADGAFVKFKLRQLEGFVLAARHASFSKAAAELAMTQPAFSQLVRELERALEVKLFERTTRKVQLTDAGRRFLGMVEAPLDDLQHAELYLRDVASGRRGRIVFASLPSAAYRHATQALARFKAEYSGIAVRLVEEQNLNIIDMVVNREIDFGIGALSGDHPELSFMPWMTDEPVAVFPARHRFAKRAALKWKDLAAESLVLLLREASVRELAETGLAAAGRRADPAYEVAGMVTALGMVRAGLGVTVLPRIGLQDLNLRGLAWARLVEPRLVRTVGVIARRDKALSPAARAYVEVLFSATPGAASARRGSGRRERLPATQQH